MSVIPGSLQIEDPEQWEGGQVHERYPKMSGVVAEYFVQMIMTAVLGNSAPNMSIVFESGTGSVGKDGSPTGCYASVHNNESDFTFFPVEYPIYDYSKVNPVQVIHEGPLSIVSTYKVEKEHSIVYADLLQSSLRSFDNLVWFVVLVCFSVFTGLLFLRKWVNNLKESTVYISRLPRLFKKYLKPKKSKTGYSTLFETFTHMMGQESTSFDDRSGNVISILMTVGFFLILVFYLNLMSTELVVVTKPKVINNYRDVMNEKNITVGFFAVVYDVNEFEEAEEGTIQEEFWKQFRTSHYIIDNSKDILGAGNFMVSQFPKKESILIVTSMFSEPGLKAMCKLIVGGAPRTYGWLASDPKGKQHTQGLIIRQGLNSDLIIKGQRRLKGLFEGDIIVKAIARSLEVLDFGPLSAGNLSTISEVMRCISKQVNFNCPEVETVNVKNFRYLALVCVLLFFISFTVLIVELVDKIIKKAKASITV